MNIDRYIDACEKNRCFPPLANCLWMMSTDFMRSVISTFGWCREIDSRIFSRIILDPKFPFYCSYTTLKGGDDWWIEAIKKELGNPDCDEFLDWFFYVFAKLSPNRDMITNIGLSIRMSAFGSEIMSLETSGTKFENERALSRLMARAKLLTVQEKDFLVQLNTQDIHTLPRFFAYIDNDDSEELDQETLLELYKASAIESLSESVLFCRDQFNLRYMFTEACESTGRDVSWDVIRDWLKPAFRASPEDWQRLTPQDFKEMLTLPKSFYEETKAFYGNNRPKTL